MKNKILIYAGIFGPLVYVIAVILGGILNQDYNHVLQPISDLIASGAPNKALLDSLFAIYNLFVLLFGFALFHFVKTNNHNPRKKLGVLGAIFLVAEGLFGLITLFVPEDIGGMHATSISTTGILHIVFAGLSSLTTMLTILFMGFWFRKGKSLQKYGLYSFISVGCIFVSGGLAAASIANGSWFGGLMERITIGCFMQWLFVVALMMRAYNQRI